MSTAKMGTGILRKKLIRFFKEIYVEPVGLLGFMGFILYILCTTIGTYNLLCEQTYRNDPSIRCEREFLKETPHAEDHLQQLAATYNNYLSACYLVPATFAGLLLGAWSDRIGRKLNLLFGIAGTATAMVGFCIVLGNPSLPLYIVLFTAVVSGCSGFVVQILLRLIFGSGSYAVQCVGLFGRGMVPVASFAFIADRNTGSNEKLTIRMFIFAIALNIGGGLGGFMAGAFQAYLSLDRVVLIGIVFMFIACVYTVLRIPNLTPLEVKHQARIDERKYLKSINMPIPKYLQQDIPGVTMPGKDVSVRQDNVIVHVAKMEWESLKAIVRPREANRRAFVLITLGMYFVAACMNIGLSNCVALFTQRRPLSWNASKYGFLVSFRSIAGLFGSVLFMGLTKKLLKWRNVTIIIVGLLGQGCSYAMLGVATKDWMVYAAELIGCFGGGVISPLSKAFVTQMLTPDEIGKVFSAFGLALDVGIVFGTIFFNSIYKATEAETPGAVFEVSAVLLLLSALAMSWIWWDSRSDPVIGQKSFKPDTEQHQYYVEENGQVDLVETPKLKSEAENNEPC